MIQFIKQTLNTMKYDNDRHTISYMFRHFLSAIFRESLYRLKLCPPNWFLSVRHGQSVAEVLKVFNLLVFFEYLDVFMPLLIQQVQVYQLIISYKNNTTIMKTKTTIIKIWCFSDRAS